MTIIDPGLPEDHPRAMYHHNLVTNESVTWYSDKVGPRELITYLLTNFGLTLDDLLFDDKGSAQTQDKRLHMTAVVSEKGPAVSVWGFDGGEATVNQLIEREWDLMMSELSRGEYTGSAIGGGRVGIKHGELHDHFFTGNPDVLEYINGATVVTFFDAAFLDSAEPAS